jgi:hypothetical protein
MNDLALARYGVAASTPVTCAICDCRLAEVPGMEGSAWQHYRIGPGQDARGCRPRCLDELHARDGTVGAFRSLETLMTTGGATPA